MLVHNKQILGHISSLLTNPLLVRRSTALRQFSTGTSPKSINTASATVNKYLSRNIRLTTGLALIIGGGWCVDTLCNKQTEVLDGKVDSLHVTASPGPRLMENNAYVHDYLNETYRLVGAGGVVTFLSAFALHKTQTFQRLMARNPVGVTIASLMASGAISSAAFLTPTELADVKLPLFAAYAVTKGVFVSSTLVINPRLLIRAGLYVSGLVGSLAWIGATTKSDNYIWTGGPLMGVITSTAIGLNLRTFLPPAMHSMPKLFSVYLYGGLAIFGTFILKDMEKVIRNGKRVYDGEKPRDTLNEALRLYTDFMNIVP
ncbi:inhibitor of apoptosis-promoting Bax1-domain-containing protein [Obelidium mucronatum]|nr:inhibitor of apoptosis-promoting Bax1-domain-containing protein [Obelidium mucronatum]